MCRRLQNTGLALRAPVLIWKNGIPTQNASGTAQSAAFKIYLSICNIFCCALVRWLPTFNFCQTSSICVNNELYLEELYRAHKRSTNSVDICFSVIIFAFISCLLIPYKLNCFDGWPRWKRIDVKCIDIARMWRIRTWRAGFFRR